jgi:replicative DNA helicase
MGLLGLIDKFVAAEAEINIGTLRAGQYINSTFAEIMQSIENMAKLKLYFYRGKAQTSELRRACEMMKATYGLELLVIDYLQLFRDMPTASETERVTYISREINSIAKDLDIPVLCLSQLSRMPEGRTDKRPQLSDLRSSGALEQDADVVLFLFRKNYYDPDNTDSETELIISKQRLGNAVGRKIKLDFNPIIGKYKGKTEYKEML